MRRWSVRGRLAGFGAALVMVLGAGYAIGAMGDDVEPDRPPPASTTTTPVHQHEGLFG